MAEGQSKHRMALESTVIGSDVKRANAGLIAGFTIAVLFLVASVFLIHEGHDIAGTVIGTVDIVGLVTAFLTGTHKRQQNLQGRRDGAPKR